MNFLSVYKNGVRIQLHVQPRASRTKLIGEHGGALKIAVQAPPVEGAANEEIRDFLADMFEVARREVEILSGDTGRKKSVFIGGVALEAAKTRLKEFLP